MEGKANIVEANVENIIKLYEQTDLRLNPDKCEISAKNFDCIQGSQTFKDFKKVEIADLIMLHAPVIKGRAVDSALQNKVCD